MKRNSILIVTVTFLLSFTWFYGVSPIIQKTEAINALITKLARAHNNSQTMRNLFVPVLLTMFSLGGATFGMNEEIIPFVLILVPICIDQTCRACSSFEK